MRKNYESDGDFEKLISNAFLPAQAPDGFTLRVMAGVRLADRPTARQGAFAEWQRVGAALVACGALLMVMSILPPASANDSGVERTDIGRRIEDAFYDFADFISSPAIRLSELLKGGIGDAT